MTTNIQINNHILRIWSILETNKKTGLFKRLYTTDSRINIYGIYQYPDECFGIALSYPKRVKFNLAPFVSVSEPIVESYEDNSFEDCMLICAKIKNRDKLNEFSYLCESVIHSILQETEIEDAVKTFKNSLLRWKNLFENVHNNALSEEKQKGLYGELRFLKKCLLANPDLSYSIIQSYVGTTGSTRDFQGSDWAVEVKTTSTNNPQSLTINGERQLDDSMIDTLYLYHCSVEISRETGETLPDLINTIKVILKEDLSAKYLFEAKLFEAGYYDVHEYLYTNINYKLRKEDFFHIRDNFPRIRERELREGVGNVTYSISISSLESYKVAEQLVISKCLSNDRN